MSCGDAIVPLPARREAVLHCCVKRCPKQQPAFCVRLDYLTCVYVCVCCAEEKREMFRLVQRVFQEDLVAHPDDSAAAGGWVGGWVGFLLLQQLLGGTCLDLCPR